MSTHLYSVVVPDATVDEGFELAPRVIEWLLAEGVAVGPARRAFAIQQNDQPFVELCREDPAVRFEPGPGLARWVESPSSVSQTTEIEIRIGRRIHADPGSWPPDLASCPKGHQAPPPDGWVDAVEQWANIGSALLTCAVCATPSSIMDWSFGREFGFGALAITFRDPPGIADALVEKIGQLVDPHRVQLLYQRL